VCVGWWWGECVAPEFGWRPRGSGCLEVAVGGVHKPADALWGVLQGGADQDLTLRGLVWGCRGGGGRAGRSG